MKHPYCIGWHPVDSQKRTYYGALYDERQDAERLCRNMQKSSPEYVYFVDVATNTRTCTYCNGTGKDEDCEWCGHCHGKGKVRA